MLQLFDTARGQVVPFETREPGKVSMYVCGPTVYGPPHLGHGRFSLVFDVLRRYLEWSGYEVTYVSNITDIDDKIIERANGEGRPADEIARKCEDVWYQAMDAIGVKRPTHDPHATAYVDQMVDLIADLVDNGRRLRDQRRRLLQPRSRSTTTACWPASRIESLQAGARGRGQRREALAGRLRALEEGQAGRAVVAVAVGRRAARAGTPSAW